MLKNYVKVFLVQTKYIYITDILGIQQKALYS